MILLDNFPEVSNFFSKKSFNDEELKSFIDYIEYKYPERHLKKSALSLIKLQVMKYELDLEKNTKSKSNYLFDYEKLNIGIISKKLQVSTNLIIEMLKQKGFTKNESDCLDLKQYLILEDFFKSRKKAINRRIKQEQRLFKRKLKIVKKSSYKGIPVYQDISKNGGVGKLIYIKKK
ncbi:hypothetical protein [Mesoflavibacter sp. SCSIO 43206]|uniref:hypothetical protein n=1 Tax=Mesoflavibacter sp. SCSIO 43206 TaxID=2779362 RepID=UPI001CA861D8|nr:hypothetical protein [Mesoflavibacter sp. SCSIO 43206]UAB74341.1 hypothetical protein INR78_08005 [Mesoflavibacter sp. SCSIO 43206]